MIWSGGFLRSMIDNLGKKVIPDLAILLARDNVPGLVSNLASNKMNKFQRKRSGKGAVRARKNLFCLFWIKIWMILLKVLIDGGFLPTLLAPLPGSLMQPMTSSAVKVEDMV